MATNTRSLRRRNRWTAFCVATGMAALGMLFLHIRFVHLQRETQVEELQWASQSISHAIRMGASLEPHRMPSLPLRLIWATGATPELARSGHLEFPRLVSHATWPSPGEPLKSVRTDLGRTFLLKTEEAPGALSGLRVYLAVETTQDDALARRILAQRLYTILVIALATLVLADLIFLEAMRPLKELALKAVTIRPKQLGTRLDLAEFPLELHDLVASLNVTLERLQEAFQRMEHLSTDLAHELRSPIQNIRSEIEGILLHSHSDEEREEALGSALEEMDRLAAMIEQMLFLARCEDPGSELRFGSLPVGSLLQEIADYFEASADASEVTLRVEAEPVTLLADRALVQRALGNLVSNALRHTAAGGTITLRGREDKQRILLEVIDTGEGIPPEVLPRLGTRFTRAEDSRSRTKGGTGLGLAIVQGILRLHGGNLEIESELGKGTVARLSFRREPSSRARRLSQG